MLRELSLRRIQGKTLGCARCGQLLVAVECDPAAHGSAVAAVGEHQDADALRKRGECGVDVVVAKLGVEQAPGLVQLVVLLVTVDVLHLTSVAGVGEEEQVPGLQL